MDRVAVGRCVREPPQHDDRDAARFHRAARLRVEGPAVPVRGEDSGLGPNMSADAMYRPWNSVHENGSGGETAPKGGSGRLSCFTAN